MLVEGQYLPLLLHSGIIKCLGDMLQLANPRGDQLQLAVKLSANRMVITKDQTGQADTTQASIPKVTTLIASRLNPEKFRAVEIMLLVPLSNHFTSAFIPKKATFQFRYWVQIHKAWTQLLALTFLM